MAEGNKLCVGFFSLKILCCHDDTWFHLNLTFLKPWANQCVFHMEIFFWSYANELCIYSRLCLSSSWFHLRLRTDKGSTNLYILLIHCSPNLCWWNYIFTWKPAFLQDACQSFYHPGWLTLCQCYLKMHVVGEGPGAILWVLRHFLSLLSRLLSRYITSG